MSVTSDDVDYLVWRYLVESGVVPACAPPCWLILLLHLPMHRLHQLLCPAGYTHSAFTFSNEGSIGRQRYNTDSISTGALVHLLQRGMQYMELEANLAEVNKLNVLGYNAGPEGRCCSLMLRKSLKISQRPADLCAARYMCDKQGSAGVCSCLSLSFVESSAGLTLLLYTCAMIKPFRGGTFMHLSMGVCACTHAVPSPQLDGSCSSRTCTMWRPHSCLCRARMC